MKVLRNQMLWFGTVFVVGTVLFIISLMRGDENGDSFAGGFAIALAAVSLLKIAQFIRISKDPERMKRFAIAQNEERLIMIAQKSGYLTLIITVMVEMAAAITLMFMQQYGIAIAIAYLAAVQTLLFLIVGFIMSKKY